MSTLRGVVVAHAGVAAALIEAVEQIAGADSGLIAVSNAACDRGGLEERVLAAVGEGPAVVFVDMPSGSCSFAVMRRLGTMSDVAVVTGVNLAMLIEFVFHRESPLAVVTDRVAQAGVRAVVVHR